MNFLRKYWQDLGIAVAMVVGLSLYVEWQNITEIRAILWVSFVAILLHQFEEYRWPGYFGGLFNVLIFKSEYPQRYPLNPQSAMIINLVIAYVFYLLPVLFPDVIWLGLAPILMGFFQFIWHGIFANIKGKTLYNPGLFAVIFLHIPVGCWYIDHIVSHSLVTTVDWVAGTIYFIVAVYVLIIKGNMWLKDKGARYSFSKQQMGPYGKGM
ncbi:HXXEE domain-containing protein [Brevibacillus laterosporus]|uniref:HXXEE domain-containing protein n=1 Tax=Brevibacillus laterosporus TaxID=1465 RepID=UPI0003B1EA2D|nr:HXXEE domain-containing protein [Brevibacillus laterosporus]ERM20001.1 membrane protein [Brevibacillus laterosporus PE36]